jgi:hypothetical protein
MSKKQQDNICYDIRALSDDLENVIKERRKPLARFKRFLKKIFKVVDAIKLSWKDEDWSWYCILQLLENKLIKTKECIRENSLACEEHILMVEEQIDEALVYLRNYMNADDVFNEVADPWEIYDIGLEFEPLEDGNSKGIWVYGEKRKPLTKKIEKEIRKHREAKNKFEEENFEKFWNCIKKNIRWWSD